ncbi:MAG: FHA domain-containing protein [Hyphomicrobiaceae bacterium]|nr:FHA domain-containing protein [Hyphomicrobiaceae bacterium]
MKDDSNAAQPEANGQGASAKSRILGSLRDALNAASRDDRSGAYRIEAKEEPAPAPPAAPAPEAPAAKASAPPPPLPAPPGAPGPVSAADALREAKARTREPFEDPTTIAVRGGRGQAPVAVARPAAPVPPVAAANDDAAPRTQALRGKPKITRTNFHQDPVVAWLVVVGGPGLGAFRPVYEGNNAVGRSKSQRIPIDFGDETISAEEQAYIRYDSVDRSFLFVPNLAKTNIVSVNDKKPTGAVKLEMMDVIRMGQTQLAFVPFCGEAFDWSELSELKE